MSVEALLGSVVDYIRDELKYTAFECGPQPGPEPPPSAPQRYLSVWCAGVREVGDSGLRLDEEVDITATLTIRAAHVPRDRTGAMAIAKESTGIYALAEAVRALLHMSETVRVNANTAIDEAAGTTENGFVECMRYRGMSSAQPRGPEWFLSPMQTQQPRPSDCGYSVDIQFGGARRVQKIEEMS